MRPFLDLANEDFSKTFFYESNDKFVEFGITLMFSSDKTPLDMLILGMLLVVNFGV